MVPEGSALSPQQIEAVETGAKDLLESGPLQGVPLQDLEIQVDNIELFGSASSPPALRAATAQATRKAICAAHGLLLHPIMATEVVVPEENMGAVLGDLRRRHAVILGTPPLGEIVSIRCEAALDELLGYATALRSMTQGRGQFSMIFLRFDVAGVGKIGSR